MARSSPDLLADRYDTASPAWADKMRLLGYYDGYLGFLSHDRSRGASAARVADLGAGTGAMAEAWTAIHGPAADLTLIDPSSGMLDQAARVLA